MKTKKTQLTTKSKRIIQRKLIKNRNHLFKYISTIEMEFLIK